MIDGYVEKAFGIVRRFELHDDHVVFAARQRFGAETSQQVLLAGLNPVPARVKTRDRTADGTRVLCVIVVLLLMIAFPIVNAWRGFANDTWNHSQGWIAAIVVLSILAASLYPRKVEYATFYTVGAVPALSIGWRKKDARDRFDAFLNRISERIRAKAVGP